ncbi:LD-carboxypeptidase [Salicibibacter cibi]|uniref:LD-carboxypeptidase n=2 Tax=Salicibibacter cibi TaxID=2743001 RepID=A0A7T7CGX6_9BACI|nr:S66 peptidase family protein [Salicibibacter cibi]QQK81494.1 LD-carboxypeptidase [Salicibibacter cibi]
MKAGKLTKGDKVGIISPSTPAPVKFPKRFKRGKAYLESMGLDLVEGCCTNKEQSYRSSTIRDRAEEINEFIRNPEIKAIISTIGGMNSNSLLPYIDYQTLEKHPKIMMGYSDITALLLGIYKKTGLHTFYGPAVVPSFGEYPEMLKSGADYVKNELFAEKKAPYTLEIPDKWTEELIDWHSQDRAKTMVTNEGWKCVRSGKASGKLIGGNLNVMFGFIGTAYFPDLKNAILFIEDSFKDMATEERLFSMLKLHGVFDQIQGLIIGKHEHFDDLGSPFTQEDLLLEVIGDRSFPILANVDIGHTFPSHVFPIGIKVELDADNGDIVFAEKGVH